tara:strand:- start:12211 stop:13401 length:1191 start_codon:yes stop_codon:yes gene_type:complete
MAKTYKPLLGDDIVNTRTMLHEAIPITGTIASGTYNTDNTEHNVKNFSHGMFNSVYDYPYLSSSANQIFDVTFGISANASASAYTQNAKKLNIYNQMAQVLFGYDISGSIRKFESDGAIGDDNAVINYDMMNQCFFINFSRLLVKDEIKKGSFSMQLFRSGSAGAIAAAGSGSYPGGQNGIRNLYELTTVADFGAANEFRTCPAGDYGILFTGSQAYDGSSGGNHSGVGLIFYQAGIIALTSSFFSDSGKWRSVGTAMTKAPLFQAGGETWTDDGGQTNVGGINMHVAQQKGTIEELAKAFRHRIYDIDFNNTIELNSAIHFCRVNHNEYNYSSNPTYVSNSKIVVKNNVSDLPVTYITSVGLYSPDNELMAVAKLSEPIRKDPNTELTLRVRLDY